MENSGTKNLYDLVSDFDIAMLVTYGATGMHARPMTIARLDKEMHTAYLVTDINSVKVDEISADPHALLTFQGVKKFATVSGDLAILQDRELIEQMWKEAWTLWFPKGKSDPSITLLKFTSREGEFWDGAGIQGLKFVYTAVKALIAGERAQTDADQHDKVILNK